MKVVRESIFSVFIDSKLLIFLFSGRIHFSMDESVLMLSYIALFMRRLIDLTYSILELDSITRRFLSFSHPSIYPHPYLLFSILIHNLESDFLFLFRQKGFSCYKDMTDLSYLDRFFGSR